MEDLNTKAKQLLKDGIVSSIIGYSAVDGTRRLHPFTAKNEFDADKLTFGHFALNNLSGYLSLIDRSRPGRTGIVVKGCDVQSVLNTINATGLKREDIYIIGVECGGVASDYLRPWNKENIASKCQNCPLMTPRFTDALVVWNGEKEENKEKLVA